jgi:hypothetical protein
MDTYTPTKNNFFGTPLGIILAVIFFPLFFTYWVYKRDWNPKAKLAFMLGFWLLIFISQIANIPQKDTATNAQPTSQTPTIPTSVAVAPSFVTTYPPIDKNPGNNSISAKYAQQYMDFANKTAPGAIKDVYLKLLPEDQTGKTEEEYKKSTSDAFLTVTVNSTYWNIPNESTKRNLIASAVNELKNTFSGYPHITITDGTKTLATGELPSLTADPQITLK